MALPPRREPDARAYCLKCKRMIDAPPGVSFRAKLRCWCHAWSGVHSFISYGTTVKS